MTLKRKVSDAAGRVPSSVENACRDNVAKRFKPGPSFEDDETYSPNDDVKTLAQHNLLSFPSFDVSKQQPALSFEDYEISVPNAADKSSNQEDPFNSRDCEHSNDNKNDKSKKMSSTPNNEDSLVQAPKPFRGLPNKIIDKIVSPTLIVQDDGSIQSVLIALATAEDKLCYKEASKHYGVSAHLTWLNEESMNKLTKVERLKIKHIKITCPVRLKPSNKLLFTNSLETIIVDVTLRSNSYGSLYSSGDIDFDTSEDPYFAGEGVIVKGLVRASATARRVILIARQDQKELLCHQVVDGLGFNPREEKVPGRRRRLIWENEELLRWSKSADVVDYDIRILSRAQAA